MDHLHLEAFHLTEGGQSFQQGSLAVWRTFAQYMLLHDSETIKRFPSSTCHIFCSLNLHGVYEHSQGKQKVERGRELLCVEESHYSVMDCTCQTVSALFILPKH